MLDIDAFVGRYDFQRLIEDRLTNQSYRVEGKLYLSLAETGLLYFETGLLYLPGIAPVRAERRYLWRFRENGEVAVSFEDDRPFHSFLPHGQSAGTQHLCGEDLYDVTYDFRDWPEWRAVWTVRGPRKDYTSTTAYQRVGMA